MSSRDEDGNLLPESFIIKVQGTEVEVLIVPLTRGEIKRYEISKLSDDEIMAKFAEPSYSDRDIELILPEVKLDLIKGVLTSSGMSFKKKRLVGKDDWARSLVKRNMAHKEGSMLYFLHKQGYTFLTINKLTFNEIDILIKGHNEENKK